MLQQLLVQNYAIIDEITIDFSGKLNIITGETGAGKSILMGALSLILGDRADTSVLLDRTKKCIVEGSFSVEGNSAIQQFVKESNLDAEDALVIRREITANGKSRAFINDTPVNLNQLQQLSSSLVDLHQQFDTLVMAQSDFQREVLDALGGNADLLSRYQNVFRQLQSVTRALGLLRDQKSQFDKEVDYVKFLYDELKDAAFSNNELEELDAEINLLSNAESIKAVLTKAYHGLKESDQPIVPELKIIANQLQGYGSSHPDILVIVQRLQSVQIELNDISEEIERLNDHVIYDPKRIDQINERISLGYKLLKKHGVKTTTELLAVLAQLETRLKAVLNIDETIAASQKEARELVKEASLVAEKISGNRRLQVKPLEEKVNALLLQVGMPNANLRIEMKNIVPAAVTDERQSSLFSGGTYPVQNKDSADETGPSDKIPSLQLYGTDVIEFLFDANKSGQFLPIRKVASGGELSRLMLCIKSLVAQSVNLPTMIFDEIDTGISGEAARQVGHIMKALSNDRQIICITHQPQIAGKADAHFYVYKHIQGDAVKTRIRLLTSDERITTIAKMLSGEKPTAAALENAREMVMN